MIIRDAQLRASRNALLASAEEELMQHCREYAPRLYQAAGESGIRQAVALGLRRANGYRFEDQQEIRLYIDLMLVLGSEFDSDPQFPWVRETLEDRFSRSHVRAKVLHRDLSLYLNRVMGPQKEYVRGALDRLAYLPHELPPHSQRGCNTLRDRLRQTFPQKSDDVSEDQLARIAAAATQQANEFQLPVGEGILACVMLAFGHGATHDPLYPWISGVLRDSQITSPEGRLRRLWSKLRVYTESARRYLA